VDKTTKRGFFLRGEKSQQKGSFLQVRAVTATATATVSVSSFGATERDFHTKGLCLQVAQPGHGHANLAHN
jgi:hypothetical protein